MKMEANTNVMEYVMPILGVYDAHKAADAVVAVRQERCDKPKEQKGIFAGMVSELYDMLVTDMKAHLYMR